MSITITSNFDLRTSGPLREFERVADVTARDAIPSSVRGDGFNTYTIATQENWQLQGGITNGDWVLVGTGTPLTLSPSLVPYGAADTSVATNVNFSRDLTTQILNNEQGIDLGTNTTTTRYIDPAGNDSNDGLTALTPWLTRQHAFNEMAAFLPGTWSIIAANGTYSENLLPPYNSVGRASADGGTIVENIGDEAVPANSIIAGSGTVYENDKFARGYSGNIRFAGISFVGDSTGNAISSAAGIVFVRNSQFSQVDACVSAQFTGMVILEGSTTGGTASNVGSLAQVEDGGFVYIGTDYTLTGMVDGLVLCGNNSSIKFDTNLTFACTGTGAGSGSFIRIESGDVSLGEQNAFTVDNAQQPILMTGKATLDGGQDNQMEFANCDEVGNLTDNAFFSTSVDGSGTYTISGTTPSSQNFFLNGQAAVLNQLNTTSGNPEIPMSWFTAPTLATTEYVLATDWRYKSSDSVTLPGRLLPGTSGWLTNQGISDICVPIYTAQKPEIFSRFTIKTRTGNGATATDTYTVYLNGVATTMAGTIVNGNSLTVTVSPQVLEVDDEISIFVLADATTTADTITVSY